MKKGIIIGIIVIAIIIIVVIIGTVQVRLSDYDNPKELEIIKEINAGIPFKWEYTIEDESIAKLEKSYVVRDDNKNGIVGASIYTKYVFKGLKEGTTKITFKFVSITEEDYDGEEDVYNIKVDKDLNISLVKDK